MKKIKTIGLLASSNSKEDGYEKLLNDLTIFLKDQDLNVKVSPYIFKNDNNLNHSAFLRAKIFNEFYKDSSIDMIFDISGGDLSNEILDLIDFDQIGKADKIFAGYSDLTPIINAIYKKTGNSSLLYNANNLVCSDSANQKAFFKNSMTSNGNNLFDFKKNFLRKNSMEGRVVGGNIRCLLKLAGTKYWPDFSKKILFLESYAGSIERVRTYITQLKQIGVFDQTSGLIIGNFSEISRNGMDDDLEKYILEEVKNIPICKTFDIGHQENSKAIRIGSFLKIDD